MILFVLFSTPSCGKDDNANQDIEKFKNRIKINCDFNFFHLVGLEIRIKKFKNFKIEMKAVVILIIVLCTPSSRSVGNSNQEEEKFKNRNKINCVFNCFMNHFFW